MDSLVGFIMVVKYGMPHCFTMVNIKILLSEVALKAPVHSAFTKPLQAHTFFIVAQKILSAPSSEGS